MYDKLVEGSLGVYPNVMKVKQNGQVLLQCDIVREIMGKLFLLLDKHNKRPSYITTQVQKHILSNHCAADTRTVEFSSAARCRARAAEKTCF